MDFIRGYDSDGSDEEAEESEIERDTGTRRRHAYVRPHGYEKRRRMLLSAADTHGSSTEDEMERTPINQVRQTRSQDSREPSVDRNLGNGSLQQANTNQIPSHTGWVERERNNRAENFSNIPGQTRNLSLEDYGFNPKIHSTAPRNNTNNNFSHYQGTPKHIKIEAFPKDIKPSDKLFRWKYYVSTLLLGFEKYGITSQRERAVELSLQAGEEIGIIIMTENLMKNESDVGEAFRFFDFMEAGIASHFSKLTDSNMSAREFSRLKQGETESTREYALRTRIAAQKIGLSNESLITTRFMDGLRDKMVSSWADSFNMSMEDTVAAATRREVRRSAGDNLFNDGRDTMTAMTVAAVESKQKTNQSSTPEEKRWPRSTDRKRPREENRSDRSSNYNGKEDCKRCGRSYHYGGKCRAENAQCHKCGDTGHFMAMCNSNKRVRAVESPSHHEVRNKN